MTQQYDPQAYNQWYASLSPQEQLAVYWDLMTPVQQRMNDLGFTPTAKPDHTYPMVDPRTLQSLNNAQLGELLSKVTGWLSYAVERLAYVKVQIVGVEHEMRQLSILLIQEIGSPKNPDTGKVISQADKKALADQNPRYQQLTKQLSLSEAEELLLKSKVECYDRDWKMVSRQITLRVDVNEADRATHNLPNRGQQYNTHPPGNYGAAR